MTNPIKMTLKSEVLPLALLASMAIASGYFYQHFPARVATHWDFAGQVNGWSSAGFAAFFLPLMIFGMYLLLLFVPQLDPQKERYAEFGFVYHLFKNVIIAFMTVLYFLVALNGIGYAMPIGSIVPPMIGLLFIMIGNYMGKLKLNWFIGTRTPWTLSSEAVWTKTNRLGGKLFVIGGIFMILEAFLPLSFKLPVLMLIVLMIALVPIIYSYIIYRKEKSDEKRTN